MNFAEMWQSLSDTQPAPFQVVVTKTAAGDMDADWLEPCNGGPLIFAENFGTPVWWMPYETFKELAPKNVADHIVISEEAEAIRLERARACK